MYIYTLEFMTSTYIQLYYYSVPSCPMHAPYRRRSPLGTEYSRELLDGL